MSCVECEKPGVLLCARCMSRMNPFHHSCCGKWVGGSGGHRVHEPCDRDGTWWHPDDSYAYCDVHVPPQDVERGDYVRFVVVCAGCLLTKCVCAETPGEWISDNAIPIMQERDALREVAEAADEMLRATHHDYLRCTDDGAESRWISETWDRLRAALDALPGGGKVKT